MKRSSFIAVLLLNSLLIVAQKPIVFSNGEGAIGGYDPISYFTDAKPSKGSPEFSFSHQGATWLFSSAKNLNLFKSNPEKYIPQFGGYCAYGMSKGYKAPTDPAAWTIVDSKLYLNNSEKVRTEWNKKQAEYIQLANTNWPTAKDK